MTSPRANSFFIKVISIIIAIILFIPLFMYFSEDVDRLRSEYPHLVEDKNAVSFIIKKERPKSWTNLKNISSYVRSAIVLSEDWRFFQHDGIDINQIKIALNEMIHENRFRGASTITQQTIKNVYLSKSRTFWRKIHEVILSYKIEKVVSKNKILEIYLNVIEFGPGIYGIKNASAHYFKKSPSDISPREAAFLAMLLPGPKKYYSSFRSKKLTTFAKERINTILEKMRLGKVLGSEEYETQKASRMDWEQ